MTRHARNSTAGSVYTYHEKKRDQRESGFGSVKQRLSKDSIKGFDCCSLTLQPCRNPVISTEGHLFDKEAILEYYLTKKKEIARKQKEFEKQNKREQNEIDELKAAAHRSQVEKFIATEKGVGGATSAVMAASTSAQPSTSKDSLSNMSGDKAKELPAFWVPSMTPASKATLLTKPDTTVYCPMTGKVLKIKDLIDVKFTQAPPDDEEKAKALISRQVRYMCPVTRDILSNSIPCAVLRPTGDVVTMECVEKLIKKDMMHPLTGVKLKEKDIIPLQRGGTGFASVNEVLEAKESRPVMQA